MQLLHEEGVVALYVTSPDPEQNEIFEVQYRDSGMVLKFEGNAFEVFNSKCVELGTIKAALIARLESNLSWLKNEVGGLTVVKQGGFFTEIQKMEALQASMVPNQFELRDGSVVNKVYEDGTNGLYSNGPIETATILAHIDFSTHTVIEIHGPIQELYAAIEHNGLPPDMPPDVMTVASMLAKAQAMYSCSTATLQ